MNQLIGDGVPELKLAGGNYRGGFNLAANASMTIDGGGATINMGPGAQTSIQMAENSTLTIRDTNIVDGFGILMSPGCSLVIERCNITGTNYSVLTNTNTTTTITDSFIRDQKEFAINGAGGHLDLRNVKILSGPGILLHNGTSLSYTGGEISAGPDSAINQVASPGKGSPDILLDGVVIRDRDVAMFANTFNSVVIRNSSIFECKRGLYLQNAPGGFVTIDNTSISGFGLPNNNIDREEGANFINIGTVTIDNTTIAHMRSGLVYIDVPTATIDNSLFYLNRINQLNFTRVANGVVRHSEFLGKPIEGAVDVEDFDNIYLDLTTATIEDCWIVDSPDNGVLADGSSVTMRRSFLSGSRAAGIATRRWNGRDGELIVTDSTVLNSQGQDVRIDKDSRLVASRNILGTTTNFDAFPSNQTFPANETRNLITVQVFSPDYKVIGNLIRQPGDFGLQVVNLVDSPKVAFGEARFNTIYCTPDATFEGVLYQNAGNSHAFTDNQVLGITNNERRHVLVFENSAVQDMARNWMGQPGTWGFQHMASGFTNAANNYFGAADGPSGAGSGSGARVELDSNVTIDPFLTSPPMRSVEGILGVGADGNGSGVLQTEGLRVDIHLSASPNRRTGTTEAQAYQGIMGLTEYLHPDSVAVPGLPGLAPSEQRIHANLWLDNRMRLLVREPGDSLTLDFSIPGLAGTPEGAELAWLGDNGNVTSVAASQLLSGGGARFVFNAGDELPTSTIAIRILPRVVAVPDPVVPYLANFADGALDWTSADFGVPDTTQPQFAQTGEGITASGGGMPAVAGAWESPLVAAEPGSLLRIRWRVRSSSEASVCPTFRLRVGEELFRDTALLNVESVSGGEESPGTSPRDYTLLYRVPEFSSNIKVFFDILSFNPADDLNAILTLEQVEITKVAEPAEATTKIYTADFTNDNQGWTPSDFGIPNTTPLTVGAGDAALAISAAGSSSSAGAVDSPLIDVTPGELLEIRYTLASTTQPATVPTFRLRAGEEAFRSTAVNNVESTGNGENSPGVTPRVYTVFYRVPVSSQRIRLSVDMLSFTNLDDVNSSLNLSKVEVFRSAAE